MQLVDTTVAFSLVCDETLEVVFQSCIDFQECLTIIVRQSLTVFIAISAIFK